MCLPTIIVGLAAAVYAAAAEPHSAPQSPASAQRVAPVTPADANGKTATDRKLGEGPVDFRCDNMFIYTKPNRNVCRGNVVIRRDDMLICCQLFEGQADDAWVWHNFTCSQDVRAQRGIETVWADKADFLQQDNDLILTGRPVLHRGESTLEGERVTIDVKEDHARISKPRGRMAGDPQKLPAVPAALPRGPLPTVCPLPALKR